MKKIKEIFKGPHKAFACFVVGATALFVFFWIFGPGNTVIHWAKAAVEIRRQEKMIMEYQEQNAEMDRRINMLKTNRDTFYRPEYRSRQWCRRWEREWSDGPRRVQADFRGIWVPAYPSLPPRSPQCTRK